MPDGTDTLDDAIFSALADYNDTAAVALFVTLLRESPGLRRWLGSAFLEPRTRSRLASYLARKTHPPRHATRGRHLLAWLAQTDSALEIDTTSLARYHAETNAALYGGITRAEVIQLIRRYQAGGAGASGGIALAPFLLAHAWRQAPADTPPRAALLLMSGRYFQAAFSESNAPQNLVRHLAKAEEFFDRQPRGTITRAHFGYANWWKLSVLHYMLNHPKPCYCTRDFSRHLRTQKINVDAKDIRRFCKKHSILRDVRAGRPARKNPSKATVC